MTVWFKFNEKEIVAENRGRDRLQNDWACVSDLAGGHDECHQITRRVAIISGRIACHDSRPSAAKYALYFWLYVVVIYCCSIQHDSPTSGCI